MKQYKDVGPFVFFANRFKVIESAVRAVAKVEVAYWITSDLVDNPDSINTKMDNPDLLDQADTRNSLNQVQNSDSLN